MKFRYDINALRAIAVLSVLFYHYKIPFFAGGFTGVDIFFVISGYLMSRIIIGGLDKGSFSFGDFYGKRVKRIVPALLFLVLLITLACFFFYFPKDYQINEKNGASSVLFLSNILYWQSASYFGPASDTNIFLHTWSLSVEWQFYLLYPVFLFFLSKLLKKKNHYLFFFAGLTVVIFLCANKLSKIDQTASFYLLPSRSWEMMFGGLAFLAEDMIQGLRYKRVINSVGYTLILASVLLLNNHMLWPGKYTLIPVIGTFMVIATNVNGIRLLEFKGVQFIGKISYSLYLWHWPVYVIAQYLGVEMNTISIVSMMLISVTMAFISYTYIESIEFNRRKLIIVLAMMVLFAVGTGALSYIDTNHIMFKPRALQLSNYASDHLDERDKQFALGTCFVASYQKADAFNKKLCLNIEPGKKNILLIGDSHAAALSASLKEALSKQNINIIQATVGLCYPIFENDGAQNCRDMMDYIYNDLLIHHPNEIDGAILTANWVGFTSGDSTKLLIRLNNTINYLSKKNIRAIVIGQNEIYNMPYTYIIAKEYQFNVQIRQRFLNKGSFTINTFLKKNLTPYYIDIYNTGPIPKLSPNGAPYMIDENHFSKYGADLTTQKILKDTITVKFLNAVTH